MSLMPPTLKDRITSSVQNRTNRRVDGLAVEVVAGTIVLKGSTGSFYIKQLAQSGVRDLLPDAPLTNHIAVVG